MLDMLNSATLKRRSMDLQTQLRAHRLWLDAAGGDLRIVEEALMNVIRNIDGRPPTFHEVLREIEALRPMPREDKFAHA